LAGFGADFPCHFAHRRFIAAEMRLRAAVLMWGRGPPVVEATLGGRPRRAGEASPSSAAMAWSMRARCSLRAATTFAMSIPSFSNPTPHRV
jgi:hypothetical protein